MIFEHYDSLVESDPGELETRIRRGLSLQPYIGPKRSALMLSANNAKHLNKLDSLAADVAMINLEDGVSPAEKPRALRLAALFISHLSAKNSQIVVRVNPLGEGGEEEIAFLRDLPIDAIRIPKVRSPYEVEKALSLMDEATELHLSIETKEAFQNIATLKISERVTTLYLGILDLLESLTLPQHLLRRDNPSIDYILSKFLIDSLIAGVMPFSFTYQDHRDLDGFQAWCEKTRAMGYGATSCISPKQVEIAHAVFGIDPMEIEKARAIKELFETKAAQGVSGFDDPEHGFIDEPIYKNALLVLKQAGV